MSEYRLREGVYVCPTPAGAYYAVCSPEQDTTRRLLFALMAGDHTPAVNLPSLAEWTGLADPQDAMDLLHHAEQVGWIQGEPAPRRAPAGSMEAAVPGLLGQLSEDGKAVLADEQGFYLARAGFPHEAAEELSALSADLASLHRRHTGLIHGNLRLPGAAWSVVDAAGNSQLGIWPLFVGGHRFALVLAGVPCFHLLAFADLVWALSKRYVGR